jgi:hypothetical protein
MRILILVLFFMITSKAEADDYVDTTFLGGIGQRSGELRWNIASDPTGLVSPNIISELTYSDLSISEIQGEAQIWINSGFLRNTLIEGGIKVGTNKGGFVTDSDYKGNNRTDEYSRSKSDPEDSTTLDGKLLLGYRMQVDRYTYITPMIGSIYSRQSLKMKSGIQILDTRSIKHNLGPFSSALDSTYEAEWMGGLLGINTQFRITKHQLDFRWERLIFGYYAEANWNLRTSFAHPKSFAHWGQGTGNNIEIRYQYYVSPTLSLRASYRLEDWQIKKGDVDFYLADDTVSSTQLNEVVWVSSTTSLGLALDF